jgi:glycosyltransferase involved in cell wall biosynthesis
MKISVVISAYNEEKMIKDCLESAKWAEEIIFIDNTSSDKTVH